MSEYKTYSEAMTKKTFLDRYKYLQTNSVVADETFGGDRYLNQVLYKSPEWRRFRRDIIIRDGARDLAFEGRDILDRVYIHHINPITPNDVKNRDPKIFDPENVICVSYDTHQAIHFGDEQLLHLDIPERTSGDTCPWR